MFNPFKWFTKYQPLIAKPLDNSTGIHPPHKKPSTKKTDDHQSNIKDKVMDHELRRQELNRLNIPYDLVLAAEAKGTTGIIPQKIITETEIMNKRLIDLGFTIKINYRESFECQLVFLDYQKYRDAYYKAKKVILPDHDLMEIIILREAEKIVRDKYQMTANPLSGNIVRTFESKVKLLCESLWDGAIENRLRRQAQDRLCRDRKLHPHTILDEVDIMAMMKTIVAERLKK